MNAATTNVQQPIDNALPSGVDSGAVQMGNIDTIVINVEVNQEVLPTDASRREPSFVEPPPHWVSSNQPRNPNTAAIIDTNVSDMTHKESLAASRSEFKDSFCTQSLVKFPSHLKPLAREIRRLEGEDLLYVADLAAKKAEREVYSLLPFTGSNWYLPDISDVAEGDAQWGMHYNINHGVVLILAGKRITINVVGLLIRAGVLCIIWYMLYNILGPDLMTRGGYVWDPLIAIVVSAIVGGFACRILRWPPLLGVLWISIMWHNIPELNYLTAGIYKDVSKYIGRIGLSTILSIGGFSQSLSAIKPHKLNTLLMGTLPFVCEMITHSFVAKALFQYKSNTWAFLEGSLCSSVSPTVVVPGLLYLRSQGYGVGVGPLSLLLSSAGLEVCVGIWTVNFIIGLLFNDQSITVAIILGPVQIIGGAIIGSFIGWLFTKLVEVLKLEAARMPNGKYSAEHITGVLQLSFVLFMSLIIGVVFLGYNKNLAGGGVVVGLFIPASVAHFWMNSGVAEHLEHKAQFARWQAMLWDNVAMPSLFAMVGCGINLKTVFSAEFFPKAIAVLVCSTAVRVATVFVCQTGCPNSDWKQKLMVCFAYCAKATTQAAIGPLALSYVMASIATDGETELLLEQKRMATNVMNISLVYVIVMALVAALAQSAIGPYVLPRTKV